MEILIAAILIITMFLLAKHTQVTYHTKKSVLDKSVFGSKEVTDSIAEPLEFQYLNTHEVVEFSDSELDMGMLDGEAAKHKTISKIIVLAESVRHQVLYCANNTKATRLVDDVNELFWYCEEFPELYSMVVELQELANELYDATLDDLITSDEMAEHSDDVLYGNRKDEITRLSNQLVREMVQVLLPQQRYGIIDTKG